MYISSIGQDSHKFEPTGSAKPLMLGGVQIHGQRGLAGNSDADVILHAVTNAVSGISGVNILGAITDDLCLKKGITDSKVYLKEALKTLGDWNLCHVSISIEARRPHLSASVNDIRQSVAALLTLEISDVGVTVTSGEGLTAFGKGEGIQAFVILSAYKEK